MDWKNLVSFPRGRRRVGNVFQMSCVISWDTKKQVKNTSNYTQFCYLVAWCDAAKHLSTLLPSTKFSQYSSSWPNWGSLERSQTPSCIWGREKGTGKEDKERGGKGKGRRGRNRREKGSGWDSLSHTYWRHWSIVKLNCNRYRYDTFLYCLNWRGVAVYSRRWYADSTKTQISHDWSAYLAINSSDNSWMKQEGLFRSLALTTGTIYLLTSPLPRPTPWLSLNNA